MAREEANFSDVEAMIWLLFFADGCTDLITVSEKSGINFGRLLQASKVLLEKKLVEVFEE